MFQSLMKRGVLAGSLAALVAFNAASVESKPKPPRLVCKTYSADGGENNGSTHKTLIATIPANEPMTRTGGGCDLRLDNDSGDTISLSTSAPEGEKGWKCVSRDAFSNDNPHRVVAYVIGCRIELP